MSGHRRSHSSSQRASTKDAPSVKIESPKSNDTSVVPATASTSPRRGTRSSTTSPHADRLSFGDRLLKRFPWESCPSDSSSRSEKAKPIGKPHTSSRPPTKSVAKRSKSPEVKLATSNSKKDRHRSPSKSRRSSNRRSGSRSRPSDKKCSPRSRSPSVKRQCRGFTFNDSDLNDENIFINKLGQKIFRDKKGNLHRLYLRK